MIKKGIFVFICMFVFLSADLFSSADVVSKKAEGHNTVPENAETDRQRPRAFVPANQSASTKPADLNKFRIQTPKLPPPFFANTESYGKSNYMEFGVKAKNGIAYSLHAVEEVTESRTQKTIGGSIRVPMKKVKKYFKKTTGALTFVPKQIGRGAVSLFKFFVHLF